MTKEEALDIAARAIGYKGRDDLVTSWPPECLIARASRAHADTLLREAELIERFEEYKREVSEVCRDVRLHDGLHKLDRFILPKPDPLVEVVKACGYATLDAIEPEFAADLNSTAERLGYRLKLERIEHE